jgi:hypothetical protein
MSGFRFWYDFKDHIDPGREKDFPRVRKGLFIQVLQISSIFNKWERKREKALLTLHGHGIAGRK